MSATVIDGFVFSPEAGARAIGRVERVPGGMWAAFDRDGVRLPLPFRTRDDAARALSGGVPATKEEQCHQNSCVMAGPHETHFDGVASWTFTAGGEPAAAPESEEWHGNEVDSVHDARCPTCGSADRAHRVLHPGHVGQVEPCRDAWHGGETPDA